MLTNQEEHVFRVDFLAPKMPAKILTNQEAHVLEARVPSWRQKGPRLPGLGS